MPVIETIPKFIRDSDVWGMVFEASCPICKETFNLVDMQFDRIECSCGFSWSLDIKAIGEKK